MTDFTVLGLCGLVLFVALVIFVVVHLADPQASRAAMKGHANDSRRTGYNSDFSKKLGVDPRSPVSTFVGPGWSD